MSKIDNQQFYIWFPGVVLGIFLAFFVGLVVNALYDLYRKRFWKYCSRYCCGSWVLKEVELDPENSYRRSVEQRELQEHLLLSRSLPDIAEVNRPSFQPSVSVRNDLFVAGATQLETDIEAQTEVDQIFPTGSNPLAQTEESDIHPALIVSGSTSIEAGVRRFRGPANSLTMTQEQEASTSHIGESIPSRVPGPFPYFSTPSESILHTVVTINLPEHTNVQFVERIKSSLRRRLLLPALERWNQFRGSIVLQATLPIDPYYLVEILKVIKVCMEMENKCTLQFGSWGIFYYKAGDVHLHRLVEGDAPLIVKARWEETETGIIICGLHLNGAQIKVATVHESTTLRSPGPTTQVPGKLDQLKVATKGIIVKVESLLHAAKVVEVDGCSLMVRSEAIHILPARESRTRHTTVLDHILQFVPSWTSLLSKITANRPQRSGKKSNKSTALQSRCQLDEKPNLLLEYWRSIVRAEMVDFRQRFLVHLQQYSELESQDHTSDQCYDALMFPPPRDSEYWQRGMHDINEILTWDARGKHYEILLRIRGGMKLFTGDFESSLKDFDLVVELKSEESRSALLDRALVKCGLARFSDALQDILSVMAINPALNDVDKIHVYLQRIQSRNQYASKLDMNHGLSFHLPQLPVQQYVVQTTLPDLLTGDQWTAELSLGGRVDHRLGGQTAIPVCLASETESLGLERSCCLESNNNGHANSWLQLNTPVGAVLNKRDRPYHDEESVHEISSSVYLSNDRDPALTRLELLTGDNWVPRPNTGVALELKIHSQDHNAPAMCAEGVVEMLAPHSEPQPNFVAKLNLDLQAQGHHPPTVCMDTSNQCSPCTLNRKLDAVGQGYPLTEITKHTRRGIFCPVQGQASACKEVDTSSGRGEHEELRLLATVSRLQQSLSRGTWCVNKCQCMVLAEKLVCMMNIVERADIREDEPVFHELHKLVTRVATLIDLCDQISEVIPSKIFTLFQSKESFSLMLSELVWYMTNFLLNRDLLRQEYPSILHQVLSDVWELELKEADSEDRKTLLSDIVNELLKLQDFPDRLLQLVLSKGRSNILYLDASDVEVNYHDMIGQGSSARVYKASWFGEVFACKEFTNYASFQLEAAVLATLSHPNIVQMYGCLEYDSRSSLVMEHMDYDLAALLRTGVEFDYVGAVDIMLQIAEGLQYVHSIGIVHRDLKSANILVKNFNALEDSTVGYFMVKVSDFGKSKFMLKSEFEEHCVGSTLWRAPEFLSEKLLDRCCLFKADVYSFSMICCEILTGKIPFSEDRKRSTELKQEILQGRRPLLPQECPEGLTALITRCWDTDPGHRPTFSCICSMLRIIKASLLTESAGCQRVIRPCGGIPTALQDLYGDGGILRATASEIHNPTLPCMLADSFSEVLIDI